MKRLVRASGFPERSIRHYIAEGMVPATQYRGKDTVYGDVHLTALRAIATLREQHRMYRLAPLRAWFAGKTEEEVHAFVHGTPAVVAPEPVAVADEAPNAAAPEPIAVAPATPSVDGERWTHVALLPGMMLLVREDAGDVVLRLAREIREKYGAA